MNFRKSLALLLCLALLMTSGAGAAFASAKVSAKILSIEGDVQVIRAGGEKPFTAFVNMRLTEGDRVITGTNGRAEIQMDDEVVITLVENTSIYLSELRGSGGAQQSSIGLQAGGVGSSVGKKLEENSRFEIKTPTAVMGVRGTEFFTQYFSGNVDVRVVDGFVEVTVGLTESGQVGSGSNWSGTGSGSGDPSLAGLETFTFQLGPLEQVLFAEGAQGSQLQGQIADLTLQGLPEKFIERIQEIEKDQPGKIPEKLLETIGEAIQEALDRLREQEEVARETRSEYDLAQMNTTISGDLDRSLPGFAPEGIVVPALDPQPSSGGGGGSGGDSDSDDGDIGDSGASIEILNVNSNYDLVDGNRVEFTVEVAYSMTNISEAELNIGFNNDKLDSFSLFSEAKKIVEGPSGKHTFVVTTEVRDWGSDGDFQVYVNISEKDHGSSWQPLAIAKKVLETTSLQLARFDIFHQEGGTTNFAKNPTEINFHISPDDQSSQSIIELSLESLIDQIGYDFEINNEDVLVMYSHDDGLLQLEVFESGEATLEITAAADGYETYTRVLTIYIEEVDNGSSWDYYLKILTQPVPATRTGGIDEFTIQPVIELRDAAGQVSTDWFGIRAEKAGNIDGWEVNHYWVVEVDNDGLAVFSDLYLKAAADITGAKVRFFAVDGGGDPVTNVNSVLSDSFDILGLTDESTLIWSDEFRVSVSASSFEATDNTIGNRYGLSILNNTNKVNSFLEMIKYKADVELKVVRGSDMPASISSLDFANLTALYENDSLANGDVLVVKDVTGQLRAYHLEVMAV